jgi:hypothetical protein
MNENRPFKCDLSCPVNCSPCPRKNNKTQELIERIDSRTRQIINELTLEFDEYLFSEKHLLEQCKSQLTAQADEINALKSQIDKLATFIMQNIPNEPSQNEGAVDCAIRIIKGSRKRFEDINSVISNRFLDPYQKYVKVSEITKESLNNKRK